jgi:hypothetical protein
MMRRGEGEERRRELNKYVGKEQGKRVKSVVD